jgi:hypothetical protein
MNDSPTKDIGKKADITTSIMEGSQDVLEACQSIKLMCAEIHHYFAEIFKDDRPTLLFWKRTAMEEENNAKEFALIAKLRRQNVINSIRIDLVDAEIALIYLRSLLEKMKNTPPSPEEALKTSIRLEEKITSYHLGNIVEFADPSFQKLFEAAFLADQERIIIFRKAYEELISA